MKNLNLEKLWEVCNKLSNKEQELSEKGIYISFVGYNSEYSEMDFESFIKYYNFGFEDDNIIVFNDDAISYEKYTNNDFSYIPIILLSFDETRLNSWMETEIKLQLEAQEREKVREKEDLKRKIELLQKQLINLQ
jgi:hypothetical protein